MTWAEFYLICFLVGVTFSVVSWALGSLHLHLPHLHFHFGGHHAPAPHAGHGRGLGVINVGTVAAFLAWFGGAGFLMERYRPAAVFVALGAALVSGFVGASIVFFFVAKVLVREDEVLDPADYEMVGVLGKVNSTIRAAGTGEMIFSQMGVRRSTAARSENGAEIPKGAEIVVTRYERGIAYVRRWEDLSSSTGSKTSGNQEEKL